MGDHNLGPFNHLKREKPDAPSELSATPLLAAVLKWIDFDAKNLKWWFDECDREGGHGDNTQQAYQLAYNSLVALRAKMRIELLSKPLPDGWDKMPEATDPIYISSANVQNSATPGLRCQPRMRN
jgi:hypothetical protein